MQACPRCQAANPLQAVSCHACGAALPASGESATRIATRPRDSISHAEPAARAQGAAASVSFAGHTKGALTAAPPRPEPPPTSGAETRLGTAGRQRMKLPKVFGHDATPDRAQPSTRLQQSLLGTMGPGFVTNPWFMAVIGAAVAAVLALLLTLLTLSAITSTISTAINASAGTSSSAAYIGGIAKLISPPQLLTAFAFAHGVPLVIGVSGSVGVLSASENVTVEPSLTGLLLIPAIALLVGGYVSSVSDFRRIGRFSAARGALIAPFYALIVALLASWGGSVSQLQILGVTLNVSITPEVSQAFIYGLLWGVVFGALGGWLPFMAKGLMAGAHVPARGQ